MTAVLARRRGVLLVVLVAVCALAAGCTAITTMLNTQRALRDAGYQSVSVNSNMGSSDEVDVSVKVSADATDGDAQDVARIVWNHFHERFQWLHVTVNGTGGSRVFRVYEHRDLVSMFGARNPAWDRTTVRSATERLGAFVLGGVVLVLAVIAVVAVIATRRKRSRPGGGYPGGRWQPGVGWQPAPDGGWQPAPGGEWRPSQSGGWQPAPGGGWAPNPLWPAPQGPPPQGARPPGATPPQPQPHGPPQAPGANGWGSPPEER